MLLRDSFVLLLNTLTIAFGFSKIWWQICWYPCAYHCMKWNAFPLLTQTSVFNLNGFHLTCARLHIFRSFKFPVRFVRLLIVIVQPHHNEKFSIINLFLLLILALGDSHSFYISQLDDCINQDSLEQWFPTFLMLQLSNALSYIIVISNYTITTLLFQNYNFAALMNYNAKIWYV